MKVIIYVEGPSDKAAMEALLMSVYKHVSTSFASSMTWKPCYWQPKMP